MKAKHTIAIMAAVITLCACKTPSDIAYMQDLTNNTQITSAEAKTITLQPLDQVTIIVNSKNPQVAALFNLPYYARRVGDGASATNSDVGSVNISQNISGYTVDTNGEIDFPVIGKIKIGGLTREQACNYIKDKLIASGQISDPVVTIEFLNLGVSVIGEVNQPGRYSIARDRFTIFDAISLAGDLTINGRRNDVTVVRQTETGQEIYQVDLTKGQELFASPAFYIQQNDVVYVNPNDKKMREATINGNNMRSTSFWISLASLLTSVAVLIFK
ncbi:MAG: polysaccharide biosynthesis/export family protein [Alloprevotella sp.]|nr:polysaccharide biosynthesis/export family protein [Alloprevotella sp.]